MLHFSYPTIDHELFVQYQNLGKVPYGDKHSPTRKEYCRNISYRSNAWV